MIVVPNSKGPNIHLIGAISTAGFEHQILRRGSFRKETANAFILELIDRLQERGEDITNVVLVIDNAPCHCRIEEALQLLRDSGHRVPQLERLSPYSPMLNPIENIWSKIKASVKRRNRVPVVEPPRLGEQRLVYLENLISSVIGEVSLTDISNSIQHTSSHYPLALNLQDMPAGQ